MSMTADELFRGRFCLRLLLWYVVYIKQYGFLYLFYSSYMVRCFR